MHALKKYQAGIIAVTFWLYNAWNTVHVSRLVGYYPRYIMEHAWMYAEAKPYPWPSILGTWFLFAVATAGIYYILRTAPYKASFLGVYSLVLFGLMGLFAPVDAGGVCYAIAAFPFSTLYLALMLGAWSITSSIRARWGNSQT